MNANIYQKKNPNMILIFSSLGIRLLDHDYVQRGKCQKRASMGSRGVSLLDHDDDDDDAGKDRLTSGCWIIKIPEERLRASLAKRFPENAQVAMKDVKKGLRSLEIQ